MNSPTIGPLYELRAGSSVRHRATGTTGWVEAKEGKWGEEDVVIVTCGGRKYTKLARFGEEWEVTLNSFGGTLLGGWNAPAEDPANG